MAYEEQDYNKRAFEWPVWKSILPYLKPYQKTLLVILTLNPRLCGDRYSDAIISAVCNRSFY